METRINNELESASPESSMREEASTGAFLGMLACNVILLLMLAACSPPAHAQVIELSAGVVEGSTLKVAVPMETLTVRPSPEDVSPPEKDRWQRFEEALNAGPSRRYRVIESSTNQGVRMACYEPCFMGCCVSSGGFSSVPQGFGR